MRNGDGLRQLQEAGCGPRPCRGSLRLQTHLPPGADRVAGRLSVLTTQTGFPILETRPASPSRRPLFKGGGIRRTPARGPDALLFPPFSGEPRMIRRGSCAEAARTAAPALPAASSEPVTSSP